jgi:hypothetical protein
MSATARLLHALHRLALQLGMLRPWCLLLATAGLASGLYAAMQATETWSWQLRLSLILSFWALMLFAFLSLFRSLPPPVLPQLGFLERLRDRLRLLLYEGLALLVLALTLLLAQMSLKLLLV